MWHGTRWPCSATPLSSKSRQPRNGAPLLCVMPAVGEVPPEEGDAVCQGGAGHSQAACTPQHSSCRRRCFSRRRCRAAAAACNSAGGSGCTAGSHHGRCGGTRDRGAARATRPASASRGRRRRRRRRRSGFPGRCPPGAEQVLTGPGRAGGWGAPPPLCTHTLG